MIRLKDVLLIAACVVASVPALAADMPRISYAPPTVPQEFGSGWYLRGDIGYRFNSTLHGTSSDGTVLTAETFDDSFVAGGGFGFKERWFRVDLTVDYGTQARYAGNSAIFSPYIATKIDTVAALVNGYIDLGTWNRLTPYVGAGVGASLVRTGGFWTPIGPSAADARLANFAWAAMAGVGYNVTPNLLVDAGYRYIDLGDAKSGTPNFGPAITYDRITAHEVRLGARYMID